MAVRTITTKLAVDGEKEFKKALNAVNSSLSVMKSEMRLVDAEFKGQANSAEALTARHQLLTDEVAQQEEKIRALEEAVLEASDVYGDADKRTDSYRIQLNNARADLAKMSSELETNDKYLDEARDSTDGCAKSIDEFGRKVKEAGEETSLFGTLVKANLTSDAIKAGIKSLGSTLAALPTAVVRELASGLRDALSAVKEMADSAGDIDDAAKRTGTTAEAYQQWAYAAKLGGMETSKLESLMVKQQKSFADAKEGVKATAEAYQRLGIDIDEVSNASDAFEQVIYTLADMEDETTRNALANDIFGKSYADLAPLLAEGSKGIAAWRQEIVDLGGVMSDEAVEAGANFGDSLDRLQTALDGLKNNLSGEFLPAFTDVVDGATAILSGDVDEGVRLINLGITEIDTLLDRMGPVAEAALDEFLDEFVEHFPDLVERGGDLVLKLVEGIGDAAPDIVEAAAEAVNALVNKLLDPETQQCIWDAGVKIGGSLVNGIMSVLKNLGSHAWSEIKEAFTGNPYAENAGNWDHSHASGLDRVPYDNYPAMLHRDEMVLTAREAGEYRDGSSGEPTTIIVHTHVDLDGREVGKSVTEYQDRDRRSKGK